MRERSTPFSLGRMRETANSGIRTGSVVSQKVKKVAGKVEVVQRFSEKCTKPEVEGGS